MIHFDLPMTEYLAHSAVGSSTLKNIMMTPADYKAALDQKSEDTKSTILGTAIHALLLEPALFHKNYALQPEDWGSRANGTVGGKKWKEFKEYNKGKIHIDYEDAVFLQRLSKVANLHPELDKILDRANVEVSAFTEVDGIALKARTDILCEDCTWDVKSCRESLDDENLFKIVFNNGYHFQGAHHTLCFNTHEQFQKVQSFGWIFISTSTPYPHIRTVKAPEILVKWARQDHSYALKKLKQCLENDRWEGYPTSITELQIPDWARKMYE
jgi:PDDEXK-like domain of unknown function (DUF3799)